MYDEAKNGEDVLGIMRKNGFTHIICQDEIPKNAYVHTIRYAHDPRLKDFTEHYLKKLYAANGMSVYQILYP